MFPAVPTTTGFAGLPSSAQSNFSSYVNHVFDRLDYSNIIGNYTTNTSPSSYYSTTNSTLTSPGSTSGDQFSYLQSLLSPPPPPPLPPSHAPLAQKKIEYGCPSNTVASLISPTDVSRIVNSVWERSATRKARDVSPASISSTSGSLAVYGTPSSSNLRRISSCINSDSLTNMHGALCPNDSAGLFKSPSTPRRNVSAKNLTTGCFNSPLVNNYNNNKSLTGDKSPSFSSGKWDDVYSSSESLSFVSSKSSDSSMSLSFKQPPLLFGDDSNALTLFFTKAYCFSNHFPCERLVIDGRNFCCTEQYYMYYKARIFGDMEAGNSIMATTDPKLMKRIGTTVKNFNLEQWNAVSVLVMVIASIAKYEQNPDLRRQLFETADTTLVEASPSDGRWGVGLPIDSELIRRRKQWPGQNIMGYLLTKLRDRLLSRPEFAAERRAVYAANDV